jgi:hypothetical protein
VEVVDKVKGDVGELAFTPSASWAENTITTERIHRQSTYSSVCGGDHHSRRKENHTRVSLVGCGFILQRSKIGSLLSAIQGKEILREM